MQLSCCFLATDFFYCIWHFSAECASAPGRLLAFRRGKTWPRLLCCLQYGKHVLRIIPYNLLECGPHFCLCNIVNSSRFLYKVDVIHMFYVRFLDVSVQIDSVVNCINQTGFNYVPFELSNRLH